MTNFADNIHLGAAQTGVGSPSQSGGFGFGPVGRTYVLDIVPLTLNAAAFAASQSPAAAALTLSAGTGVTAVVDATGVTRYTADVSRAITITSGGDDHLISFLVKGYDFYGAAMSEAITGANAGVATGKKAFMSVISILPSGAAAGTVTAGTADVFGLPVAVLDAGYLSQPKWAGVLAANAGTFAAADTTTPATTTTGDVRGTFAQSGSASNGARRLVILIALSAANIGGTQTVTGVLGVTQA